MLWLCPGAETSVSFGIKSLRGRPLKDSINSEVELCLHDVEVTSQKVFSGFLILMGAIRALVLQGMRFPTA